mgnify:CR=1 FL=1
MVAALWLRRVGLRTTKHVMTCVFVSNKPLLLVLDDVATGVLGAANACPSSTATISNGNIGCSGESVPSGGTCSVTCTPGYTPSTTTVTCTLGIFSSATCTGKHVWFVCICNVCLRCTILCGGAALRCFCWGPGCTTHNLLTTVYVLPLPFLLMLLSLSCSWCSQRCLHHC